MPAFNLVVVYDIEASFPVLSRFWLKLQYKMMAKLGPYVWVLSLQEQADDPARF